MPVRALSGADVQAAVDMPAAIDAMRSAFGQLSAGRARVPRRLHLAAEGGVTLVMPAFLEESGALGAKVASLFEGNRERGLPAIQGVVLLLDGRTGNPRALLDGAVLTALRTGAGSGLATELLAPPEASVLAVFGAGVQARTQIEAVRAVRPVREVRIVSRSRASAERLAAELEHRAAEPAAARDPESAPPEIRVLEDRTAALRGAEIVIAATSSSSPVFGGAYLEPGAHVCAIGAYTPEMQEVDTSTVRRARVVVDTRDGALAEAGDLIRPIREGILDPGTIVELGEIVNGTAPPGREGRQVTLYKSVGTAVQDVELARVVAKRAETLGLGTTFEL
ncbi:MAG: ornithine cyclodeaminase family protein [Gemmatimonadota bacterium]